MVAGSWDKHPAYCILLGYEGQCVAYEQWNKCDDIYSCFDKGCQKKKKKSVEAYATMPKGSVGNTQ